MKRYLTAGAAGAALVLLLGAIPFSGGGLIGSAQIADSSITSAKIVDGTIVAGDISSSAAPQLASVELSHATANTLTGSGGNLLVEGNAVYRAGGTDVPVADGGTGCSTAACARAALGLPQVVLAPTAADFTSTSTSTAAITGCEFTPVAGKRYLVEVRLGAYTAATTTGVTLEVDGGNVQNGSAFLSTQGTANTAQILIRGSLAAGVVTSPGASAPASPGRVLSFGMATFQAHASAPTAFKVLAATEVGASQVTVPTYECVIVYTQLD